MSILEKKKVLVKAFKKNRPFIPKGHDGEIRYTGCHSGYTLPWSLSRRSFVPIFKDDEQAEFEKALALKEGTLNLYERKGSWWSKFNVELTRDDKELDLSNPMQSLEYRVLVANKATIASAKTAYNGTQDYYIEDADAVEQDNFKLSDKREHAMEAFMRMRKNNSKMFDTLRVLNKKPTKGMKENSSALKSELSNIIAQVEKVTGQPNLDDFIATIDDALFQDKIFVLDAIEIGEVEIKNGSYRITTGGKPVGTSLIESAEYFHAPKNQDDKLLIQNRIELNK